MFLIGSKRRKFIKYLGWYVISLSRTVFNVSVITFIFYFALENFKTGLISNYFDLNLLLAVSLFSGLITILFTEEKGFGKVKKGHYLYLAVFAIILALFAFQHLSFLGKTGLLVSLVVSLAIFITLSLFIQSND